MLTTWLLQWRMWVGVAAPDPNTVMKKFMYQLSFHLLVLQ